MVYQPATDEGPVMFQGTKYEIKKLIKKLGLIKWFGAS